jgi:glycosyltransferase involved in cell wall biosynthesis
VLVAPLDPGDIAGGIERAVLDRESLVRRGLERAQSFRWDAVAAATVEVYREAVS